jgi:xanthine dehydrogenase YagR molybdenum-binding subunit
MADASLIGKPTPRIDGRAKVTGEARYPSDEPLANMAYAYLVTSGIARGRLTGLKLDAARAVPGVLEILTHENAGGEIVPPKSPNGGQTTTTMETDRIWHDGQIIAVVVADTFEAAREAAYRVEASYAAEPPAATFDSPGTTSERKQAEPSRPDPAKGDAAAAFAAAPVKIDARYSTPIQHHNCMELFTTTCVWDGPKLTIYESSQFMYGLKHGVAAQLKMDPENVRTVSRYVGGAFGSRGGVTSRTAWVAVAARRVKRPVKLVPTRDQCFTIATYRAETRHHVKLAAGRDGKLRSFSHEGWEVSSRPSNFSVSGVSVTSRMYAYPAVATRVNVVHADRNTPGYMRAPPDVPYMFALESAMDELAVALKMDPIELRRINDTRNDPITGKPFTSRSLMKCFDAAAGKFGWSKRNHQPGSMRDGDWQIGWGCATACYPANVAAAGVRLSLSPQGKAQVKIAGHEIGNGAYTLAAIVAADRLGIGVEDVSVSLGDSDFPPMAVAGGSNNAATTALVIAKACEDLRARIAAAAVATSDSPFSGKDPAVLTLSDRSLKGPGNASEPLDKAFARLAGGPLEVSADYAPEGVPDATAKLHKGQTTMLRGVGREDGTAFSWGAHLVEVRVHGRTREIRVPRVVSAFAAGTIVNPVTARSQYMGGAIWGLSSALHEATEIDLKSARYINDNLADYLVPVNADIGAMEIILVPEEDSTINPMGIKGMGEVCIVGMSAAVANAVFHATGKRIRDLPIRAESLLTEERT